jgi:hypothetical protein
MATFFEIRMLFPPCVGTTGGRACQEERPGLERIRQITIWRDPVVAGPERAVLG